MFWIIMLLAFTYQQPELPVCTVDQCERDVCIIETPEGMLQVKKKDSYYEGKRLMRDECPIEMIDPT